MTTRTRQATRPRTAARRSPTPDERWTLSPGPAPAAPHPPAGTVGLGSRVTAQDDRGAVQTFVVVRPHEADIAAGRISAAAPVGAALLGSRVGETVAVAVPAGVRTFTLLQVEGAR